MKRKFYLFHSVLFLLASSLCGCGKMTDLSLLKRNRLPIPARWR